MFDRESFEREKAQELKIANKDLVLREKALDFIVHSDLHKYGYRWTWLGLPIIQMPEDIVLTQELLWETKPDIVIEAGIAWGGSLAMYASFLEILGKGEVFGIDTTIPEHNRKAIMSTPVSHRINLIEGSSSDPEIYEHLASRIPANSDVLLILDSNHTHSHVLSELNLWSPLLRTGNYIVVSDTIVEYIPEQTHRKRGWGPGNNPMTATVQFLEDNTNFTQLNSYSERSLMSYNPGGYLKRVR